jgi:hypothetical protein
MYFGCLPLKLVTTENNYSLYPGFLLRNKISSGEYIHLRDIKQSYPLAVSKAYVVDFHTHISLLRPHNCTQSRDFVRGIIA